MYIARVVNSQYYSCFAIHFVINYCRHLLDIQDELCCMLDVD